MIDITEHKFATPNILPDHQEDKPPPLLTPVEFLAISKAGVMSPFFNDDIFRFHALPSCNQGKNLPVLYNSGDPYEVTRKDSGRLLELAKTVDSKISKKVAAFITINVEKSTLSDVDKCVELLKEATMKEVSMSLCARTVSTHYQLIMGQLAAVLQRLVKRHKLDNWKQYYIKYFPTISYETLNVYKNVAEIRNVEAWKFLGIWKLNQLRLAIKELKINSMDPIRAIGEVLGVRLTDDLTENEIERSVEKAKFKRRLWENDVHLDNDLIDALSSAKIELTETLVKNLVTAKNSEGDPNVLAEQILANKGSQSPISKDRSIPDQLSFDAIVAPFSDVLDVILKTDPANIKLDFKQLDKVSEKLIVVKNHLSKNPFQ